MVIPDLSKAGPLALASSVPCLQLPNTIARWVARWLSPLIATRSCGLAERPGQQLRLAGHRHYAGVVGATLTAPHGFNTVDCISKNLQNCWVLPGVQVGAPLLGRRCHAGESFATGSDLKNLGETRLVDLHFARGAASSALPA